METRNDITLRCALSMCGTDLIHVSGRLFERAAAYSVTKVGHTDINRIREIITALTVAIDAYEAAENGAEAEVTIITPPAANVHPAVGGVQ